MFESLTIQIEDHSEKVEEEMDTKPKGVVDNPETIVSVVESSIPNPVNDQSQEMTVETVGTALQPVTQLQEALISPPASPLSELCDWKPEELKALTELLPEDSWDESVHSSGNESDHSWNVIEAGGETLGASEKSTKDEESSESHLIIRHNIIFSDSESMSVPSSPEHNAGPEPLIPESFLEAIEPESGVQTIQMDEAECVIHQPLSMSERAVKTTIQQEPVESHSSASILPESLVTPPRPTHKRDIVEVMNESPFCSPSKILATAVPALPVIETPTRPRKDPNTVGLEQSPTKVIEEQKESRYRPFSPYQASDFVSLKETGQPLSSKIRRILIQQEQERNRFQMSMRKQMNGLNESFEQERQQGKVIVIQ